MLSQHLRRFGSIGFTLASIVLVAPAGAWVVDGSQVCTALTNQTGRQLVADGAGGVIVTWTDPRDAGTTGADLYAQRLDAAGNALWALNGVPVCNAPTNQVDFETISDGAGGAILVWVDSRSAGTTGADLYAQRVDPVGNMLWAPNGVAVCTAPTNQTDFELVADGASGVIVVWHDPRDAGTTGVDIYAQRIASTGVAQWAANGVALCTAPTNQANLVAISDGAGGAITVWIDSRDAGTTGADIYARRISAAGAPLWTGNGVAVCTAPTNQTDHRVISDDASGVIVIWGDTRDLGTTGADIYARRVDASGTALWTPNGVAVCNAPTNQSNFFVVTDGASGVVTVWLDPRDAGTTGVDIYARRVNGAGAPLWTANGVVLCNALTNQTDLEVIADGAAGAIAVWTDQRDFGTSGADIYARRVDVNGTPLWTPNGVAVCTEPTNQSGHTTMTDGLGGAMVFWTDTRDFGTSGADLFGQQLDAAGTVLCTTNGVPMCQANTNQTNFVVTASGVGGAIIAWQEGRNAGTTGADIYAQRLCACTAGATSCGTVPVLVSDLEATPGDTFIDLAWLMGDESGTVAVFRADNPDGELRRASSDLEARAGARMQYRDATIRPGITYEYAIGILAPNGVVLSGPVRVSSLARHPDIDLRVVGSPRAAGSALIEFEIPAPAMIHLDLYSVDGRKVRTLVEGRQPAGVSTVLAGDADLPSGLYFAALRTPWGERRGRVLWLR